MTAPDAREAPEAFIDKFRSRWPEWTVAIAFVPAERRPATQAWLALGEEFADAAWAGAEAAPGLAKLAWWQDELQGWSRGARRHPLAQRLRAQAVDWVAMGRALNVLPATRELDGARALAALQPLAEALAAADAALAGDAGPAIASDADLLGAALLAERALRQGGRDEARRVLDAWPQARGAGRRVRRIQAALLRYRLEAMARGREPAPLPAWRVLPVAWRAARG
ncbi:hypothetical protein [Luteimonas huabeiensis]|uniref:hypothetical protein n=1 Tax=Luteimonas huabeiensis TaxID=1244513 RepID=UPI00046646CB|nr:hypothetical protein [Luteimonas huabeiensis]